MTLTTLLWLLLVPALAEPTPEDVRRAMEDVYEAGDYQRDLPGVRAVPVPNDLPDSRPEVRRKDRDYGDAATGFGDMARALMWIIVAACAAFALVWLVREIPQRGWRKRAAAAAAASEPVAPSPEIPEPRKLAAAGRYGEAIHVLLLELIAKLGERVAPAWTSREVLRRLRWPDEAKEPVRNLVGRVEQIRFAGKVAGAADFEAAADDAERAARAVAQKKAAL